MKTMKRAMWLGLSGLLLSTPAFAKTQAVTVDGVAAIVNGDKAMARDRALDDAKRKAVEQVAGSQVSAQTITENFQLVEDKIYARASGFVRTYKIASENVEEGVYRVRINAEVDEKAIADDLTLLFASKPRVLVMIAEQNVGSKGFSYWWGNSGFVADLNLMQSTLIQAWQPKGFKFVDPAMLKDSLTVKGPMQKPGIADDAVVSIGRDTDADIVIVGKILVSDAGQVMDGVKMHSYHAVGSLRLLNVDTGEIVAVTDDTGVAAHVDPNLGGRLAIKALAKKLSPNLEKKIMARWTAESAGSREIELVAENVRSSKQVREIARVLKEEIRGVESVNVRRRKRGKAFITVKVRASATDLARDLEQRSFSGFGVEIESATRGKLIVSLKK